MRIVQEVFPQYDFPENIPHVTPLTSTETDTSDKIFGADRLWSVQRALTSLNIADSEVLSKLTPQPLVTEEWNFETGKFMQEKPGLKFESSISIRMPAFRNSAGLTNKKRIPKSTEIVLPKTDSLLKASRTSFRGNSVAKNDGASNIQENPLKIPFVRRKNYNDESSSRSVELRPRPVFVKQNKMTFPNIQAQRPGGLDKEKEEKADEQDGRAVSAAMSTETMKTPNTNCDTNVQQLSSISPEKSRDVKSHAWKKLKGVLPVIGGFISRSTVRFQDEGPKEQQKDCIRSANPTFQFVYSKAIASMLDGKSKQEKANMPSFQNLNCLGTTPELYFDSRDAVGYDAVSYKKLFPSTKRRKRKSAKKKVK